jgi:hypothetical protein
MKTRVFTDGAAYFLALQTIRRGDKTTLRWESADGRVLAESSPYSRAESVISITRFGAGRR